MTRLLILPALFAIAVLSASCGCKQPLKTPELRSEPNFREIPAAQAAPGSGEATETQGAPGGSGKEVIPVVPAK